MRVAAPKPSVPLYGWFTRPSKKIFEISVTLDTAIDLFDWSCTIFGRLESEEGRAKPGGELLDELS
jgi:hypothetical protein